MTRELEVRVDKWLWAVRVFKTRSIASEACKKGRVMVNGKGVKPSRILRVGETVQVKKPPVTYHYKVLAIAEKRMGAKLVPDYMKDVTPKEELAILDLNRLGGNLFRGKGEGRPTKKERRDLDKFSTDWEL